MADAEDLKSSGDFSSCGFDSHPVRSGFEQEHDEVGELASSNEDFDTSWQNQDVQGNRAQVWVDSKLAERFRRLPAKRSCRSL